MNDQDLRALVREAVARHLRPEAPSAPAPQPLLAAPSTIRPVGHASHHLYLTVINAGDACVIEPNVTCDHCGYCKSHGH
jgi:hypothetical protein